MKSSVTVQPSFLIFEDNTLLILLALRNKNIYDFFLKIHLRHYANLFCLNSHAKKLICLQWLKYAFHERFPLYIIKENKMTIQLKVSKYEEVRYAEDALWQQNKYKRKCSFVKRFNDLIFPVRGWERNNLQFSQKIYLNGLYFTSLLNEKFAKVFAGNILMNENETSDKNLLMFCVNVDESSRFNSKFTK